MNPLATYLRELRDIRASGASVPETSFYGSLADLLNAVGRALKPRVRCIITPNNQGGGIPDGGFFTADQLPRTGEPDLHAQLPEKYESVPPRRCGGAGATVPERNTVFGSETCDRASARSRWSP